ncbi:MAG: gluconokinase [Marinomonas sp.]
MSKKIFFVMGVSGCGKSSIGEGISSYLSIDYIDSDTYHPASNVEKMKNGIPLTDEDRKPWLDTLNKLATECIEKKQSIVIASSCLKPSYRKRLQQNIEEKVVFIYLKGSFEKINERMKQRKDHYFSGEDMLKSQFASLVEPEDGESIDFIQVEIDQLNIQETINSALNLLKAKAYI